MAPIDDPAFGPPPTLPFPVGASPFRQKGNAYLGDVAYLDATISGGFAAAVAALPDPLLRTFFLQKFRGGEWYDAYPGMALEVSAARLRGISFATQRRRTGSWHAEHAARGLYGTLLRLVSNESLALWAPRISSLYFEFGKTETRVVAPREIVAVRGGVPRELVQWVIHASVGFCETTLRLAGAARPTVAIEEIEPDGAYRGRELMRVHLRLTWL